MKVFPKGMANLVPIVQASRAQQASTTLSSQGVRVLVIDDDEMIAWAWRKQQKRLGLTELCTFPSMEACESAGVNYSAFDLAFVDLRIKDTTWQIDQVIRYLKEHGVKRVLIASGSDEAKSDPLCRGADGIVSDKVPQDLARYLNGGA